MDSTRVKIKLSLAFLVVLLAGILWLTNTYQLSEAGSWSPVSGTANYYARTDYEGFTCLGYSSGWFSSPECLLGQVTDFAKTGNLLVVRKPEPERYFLLDAAAPDLASAKTSFAGPLSRAMINQRLLQQLGDSTIHFSPFL